MQRVLVGSVWDADLVRDDLRQYVVKHLGNPQAVLAIDETSFPKRGDKQAHRVQHLATLHHRPLPSIPLVALSAAPEANLQEALLRLQEQLAWLALEVLRGRKSSTDQRLNALEALVLLSAASLPLRTT